MISDSMREEIRRSLQDYRENVISTSSRSRYRSSMNRFIAYLYHNRRYLLQDEFVAQIDVGERSIEDEIKAMPDLKSSLKFDDLVAADFLEWTETLVKSNGERPGIGSLKTHCSALVGLFRDAKKKVSTEMAEEFSVHYKSKAGSLAQATQRGERRILEGKMPLPFELYRKLALESLCSGKAEDLFFRSFMTTSWNLLTRSA